MDRKSISANDTFTKIDDGLANFKGLTAFDVLIHARIDGYKKGEAWPSYEYLASFARCSRRSAMRSVKKLEKLGLLRVERRRDTTCLFAALKPWERKQGVTECHPNRQGLFKASPYSRQQQAAAKEAIREQFRPTREPTRMAWEDNDDYRARVTRWKREQREQQQQQKRVAS